ncbi:spore gernimation protein [Heyndrickxia sporothermodurans]|uniref:Ger(X)C family spore germination protein n=1 Tax=Heyndrickxia sporothermodurans TaxID=46224 RepID=A0AB37HDJ5_9BACI|nr:Ger(x)C family spore germination protein [Heyndrickxia sporothermodurans]MBL5769077.1 Ger(x)C family spore germination protein [Heyndrickxia sporothermodurans]MBL5772902.1 Ger(x)C family spore germination protein [Heyndrickxia sporothermodurans]MBL5776352.1 Ger(x)C family spore germination protein [Heyndrickxia sporothermodurans]MBL5779865.1 Ger(x)C family spore germination protein [Heyndrickxia sporothermodurans]MBL5783526.1 Ger(x)C family spore germination protein [Heyndrickxia sporotherm
MKKMVILLCSLLCTACMAPEKIIETQGISTIIGYDLLDDNTYKGTISLLQFDRKEEKTSVTLSAEGTTNKQIRQKLEEQTSHDITSGQLRSILFNKNMAETGISSFLDTTQRDSMISSLIFLAITDNAEETINNTNYEEYPEMGSYIYQLLNKHEEKEMLVNSNLHDFITTLYEIGIDPTLPIIKNSKGVAPSIDGVALFKEDKIVGSISLINTLYIKLFTNKKAFLGDITVEIAADELEKRGMAELNLPKSDSYKITLHPIKYKGNIEIKSEELVHLNATISVSTLELQPTTSLNNKETLNKMEQLISEALNKEFGNILEEFKNLNTDPIGIGRKIRSVRKYSHLTEKDLRQKYSALKIKPNIKVEIKRTGTVD